MRGPPVSGRRSVQVGGPPEPAGAGWPGGGSLSSTSQASISTLCSLALWDFCLTAGPAGMWLPRQSNQ